MGRIGGGGNGSSSIIREVGGGGSPSRVRNQSETKITRKNQIEKISRAKKSPLSFFMPHKVKTKIYLSYSLITCTVPLKPTEEEEEAWTVVNPIFCL